MFRSLAKYVEKVIDITSGKVVRAGDGDELKNHASENVQHRSKRSIHKRNDWTSAGEVLLLFGQDVARGKLTTFADSPRIGPTIFVEKVINQGGGDVLRCVGNRSKNLRVEEGFFNGLMV